MEPTQKKYSAKLRQKRLSNFSYSFFDPIKNDAGFYGLILMLSLVAWGIAPYPRWAAWFGFLVSSYGVISNDSIQTLGIFITANAHRTKWWWMCGFISLIFFGTVGYSWYWCSGDVSYHRIAALGLSHGAREIGIGQLLTPVLLLLFTHWRVPVSTTFLLLSAFSSAGAVQGVVLKSFVGYGVAFVASFLLWYFTGLLDHERSVRKPQKWWFLVQWGSSALLWIAWIVQDGVNMAVFLPYPLSFSEFLLFSCSVIFFLGLLFYTRGNRLQAVVNEKTGITDIRAATNANIFYMLLLFLFAKVSRLPMSTTWLFIGLLGGRELAIGVKKGKRGRFRKSIYLIWRDLCYASVGLVVSLVLSAFTNPELGQAMLGWLRW